MSQINHDINSKAFAAGLDCRKRNLCMDWTGMAMEGADFPQHRSIV
jgi:hypothetical protein